MWIKVEPEVGSPGSNASGVAIGKVLIWQMRVPGQERFFP